MNRITELIATKIAIFNTYNFNTLQFVVGEIFEINLSLEDSRVSNLKMIASLLGLTISFLNHNE